MTPEQENKFRHRWAKQNGWTTEPPSSIQPLDFQDGMFDATLPEDGFRNFLALAKNEYGDFVFKHFEVSEWSEERLIFKKRDTLPLDNPPTKAALSSEGHPIGESE